jgi:hypothetical protein
MAAKTYGFIHKAESTACLGNVVIGNGVQVGVLSLYFLPFSFPHPWPSVQP